MKKYLLSNTNLHYWSFISHLKFVKFSFMILYILPPMLHSSEKEADKYFNPDNQRVLSYTTSNINDTTSRIILKENRMRDFSILFANNFSSLLNELCDTNSANRSRVSNRISILSSLISKKAAQNWRDSLPKVRSEIMILFNSNYMEIAALSDNDVFSKYRFYKYVVNKTDLAQWFDEWGINVVSRRILSSIRSSYENQVNSFHYELLFPKDPSNESAARALLLNNLFKNAKELFLFSRFIQIKSKIDTLWLQPCFVQGFYRYSFLNLIKNPEAPRVNIPENMTVVMHKLRTAFKDALWIEEPTEQIGYIFQDENTTISQADSILISSALKNFAVNYSHMRVKKEHNDTTKRFDYQLKYIDSLVENEILRIKSSLSSKLFQYLDTIPPVKVSTRIDFNEYIDIFSLKVYWNAFIKLRDHFSNMHNVFESSIPEVLFDSLKIPMFQTSLSAAPISYSQFSKVLQQLAPKYYNNFLLLLGEYFEYFYVGDSEKLENAIYFKWRLK